MSKKNLILFFLILIYPGFAFAEESITLTTYYPSPYASHYNLTATNNVTLATAAGSRVGIGTASPAVKLDVYHNGVSDGLFPSIALSNVPTGQSYVNRVYISSLASPSGNYASLRFSHYNGYYGSTVNSMFIDGYNGNVGVGTASIAAYTRLHIYDPTFNTGLTTGDDVSLTTNNQKGYRILPYSNGNIYIDSKTISGGSTIFRTGAGAEGGHARTWMTVYAANGNVGIGTLASNGPVYSNGTLLTNTNPSSENYKENIANVNLRSARLLRLKPKSFVWRSNKKQDIGYIAEEVREVFPELYQDDGTTIGYDAAKLPVYIIELLKEQQLEIENLKLRISKLEK